MTIQELKTQIESGHVTDDLIIMKDSESNFISNQYIMAIAKIKNQRINYIDSPEELLADSESIFSTALEKSTTDLNVLKTDIFIWVDENIAKLKNLIIVVSKFQDKNLEKQFEQYIVKVPKLESWQIQDYVYSVAEGVPQKDLEWLINLCGTNRHRLQQELDKILLFGKDERKYLFTELERDGAVDDLSSYSVFNFTNALVSKDYRQLRNIYQELDKVDINEFGLLTILVKNFRNLIMVQLNSNPTPENTGLDGKQLYAIKKLPRVYTPEQLVNIYQLLLDIDRLIKSGELPTEILIDYLVLKILSQ